MPDVSPVHTHDGVDRADRSRRGSHLVDQRHDRLFVWHGEVVPVDPCLVLAPNHVGQLIGGDLETLVSELDAKRTRRGLVHLRRFRVRDRPAEDP